MESNGASHVKDFSWKDSLDSCLSQEVDDKQIKGDESLEDIPTDICQVCTEKQNRPDAITDMKGTGIQKSTTTVYQVSNVHRVQGHISKVQFSQICKIENDGEFYDDKAYIVVNKQLQGAPDSRKEIRNVHVWISKHCSPHDYHLALVKAKQLVLLLGENTFLRREIQLSESDAFHSYFPVAVQVLYGGVPSKTRLLHVHVECTTHPVTKISKPKKKWLVERNLLRGNLRSDDVFVLINENTSEIFQWIGAGGNDYEKKTAQNFVTQYKKMQKKRKVIVKSDIIEEKDQQSKTVHRMYELLSSGAKEKTSADSQKKAFEKNMNRITDLNQYLHGDNPGKEACKTKVCRSVFVCNSMFFLDTEFHLHVWIGKEYYEQDPCQILLAAEKFLKMQKYSKGSDAIFKEPGNKPITLVKEGDDDDCIDFNRAFMS